MTGPDPADSAFMSEQSMERPGGPRPRVLFVEDDDALREHLARVLSDDYVVDAAANGEQALLAVLAAKPDLVVADVVMPGLDGVELVKTLRERPSTETIPVLLTSGLAPEELRIEGFEHGADGYLSKPYTERELRARIRSMLHAADLRREEAQRLAREEAEKRAVAERAAILESITDAFFAMDRRYRFTYVNQRALEYYSKTREEILGRTLWEAFPTVKGTVFEEQYALAFREERVVAFEAYSDRAHRWLEVHAYPSPQGLAVNLRDITLRRRAEEERQAAIAQLRGREQRLQLATEIAGLGIFVWDMRTDRVDSENLRSYEIFGRAPGDPKLSSEEFLGRFVHPEDRPGLEQRLQETLRGDAPLRVTCRIRRQNDGALRWLEIIGSIDRAADGAPERMLGVLRDVTEERLGEEAVRDREERFRTLAEAVPSLVFVSDPDGENVYTNAQFQQYTGLRAVDLLGDGWLQVVHEDDRSRAAEIWSRAVASGGPYEAEYRFRRLDGVYRWFLVRGRAVREADGQIAAWYGTCTDVDEALRTAAALSEEKQTIETLHALGQAIAAELDLELVVQAVTDAATKLSGAAFGAFFYDMSNIDGESYSLYALSGVGREAFAGFATPRNSAVFAPTFNGAAVVRSDDITKDPRYGRTAPHFGMPPGHLPVRSYLAAPVISRSGAPIGALVFGHPDPGRFTERGERLVRGIASQAAIAIDNAGLYKALREADQRKDRFLAVLAHELRNPLAPIRNGLQIVRLRATADATIQGVLNMMDRQMTHVVRLVDDLLDISRITSGKLELRRKHLLLADVAANAIDASRVFIEAHGHQLIVESGDEPLTVEGDPERLTQVFANLLSNSAKYTPRGGRIVFSLARERDAAIVQVCDNGIGIPPESIERVFEMFTQVGAHHASSAGGLGIGLSLARTLVELHGGRLSAFSAGLGRGSTFTVQLPLAHVQQAEPPSAAAAPAADHRPPSERRRVLVVDDNADAAASLAVLLELDGHLVKIAGDGLEAVEHAQNFDPEIIFMDLGMPRVDGFEATRRIRALPSGKSPYIIALTGWGQAADRRRAREAGVDQHLVKPISPVALTEVLTTYNERQA
jgi:PAS domain S-box-containing protein